MINKHLNRKRNYILLGLGLFGEKKYIAPEEIKNIKNKGHKTFEEFDGKEYYYVPHEISDDEFSKVLEMQNYCNINTIKKCAPYFTYLSIIGIFIYLIVLLVVWLTAY